MTSDFEEFSIPDFIHYINSLERASISILMMSAKQGNYWYQFYYIFGMTRSLSGIEPGPPALEAGILPLGYRGGSVASSGGVCLFSHYFKDSL